MALGSYVRAGSARWGGSWGACCGTLALAFALGGTAPARGADPSVPGSLPQAPSSPGSPAPTDAAPAPVPAIDPDAPEPAVAAAPAPGTAAPAWWEKVLDQLPFVPFVLVDASPNGGLNLGFMPIVMSANEHGQIDTIAAPDIIHSQYFGWGAHWRYVRNPSEDRKWSLVAGAKQHAERTFDWEEDAGLLRNDDWSWMAHAMYDRTATDRFYGLGNNTQRQDQTTYVDNQSRLEASLGRNFSHALQLAYGVRFVDVEIERGVLPGVPSIETLYAGLPGVGDEHELQQRLELAWDTRDSAEITRTGERFVLYAGFAQRGLLSTASYTFWGIDASLFRRVSPDTVFAGHAALRILPSDEYVPFWALSSVGGDRAVIGADQPLRAVPQGRYIDRNSFSTTLEMRHQVAAFRMFESDLSLEIDPFVDLGKVFTRANQNPFDELHTNFGVGFRVLANPFVVGYLDLGYAGSHTAVFTGIDYPF